MKQDNTNPQVASFLPNHWFKIALIAVFGYMAVQKEMSFSINMNGNDTVASTEKSKQKALNKTTSSLSETFFGSAKQAHSAKEAIAKISNTTARKYFNRFAKVAQGEQRKFNIPASITLANAYVHSLAGTNELATAHKNYFALPCMTTTSNTIDYKGNCYEKFSTAWLSFRKHSEYITTGQYASLKNLGASDYKRWATALEGKGYSEKGLGELLIQVIEQFELTKFD